MSHPSYLDKYILAQLPEDLRTKKIIDLGCGFGKLGLMLKMQRNAYHIDGVDIYKPYIDIHRDMNIYTNIYNYDVNKFMLENMIHYDIYLAIEIVEHLTESQGLWFINQLARQKGSIRLLSTPKHFRATRNIDLKNRRNKHISGYNNIYQNALQREGFNQVDLDKGIHLNMWMKNAYCVLTNRPKDSVTQLWIRDD